MFYVLKSSSKVAALVIEAKCTETATGLEHALSPGVLYFLYCLKLGYMSVILRSISLV